MASFRNAVCWGVMFARGDDDRFVGHQGFRITRTGTKGNTNGRTFCGPVRETWAEAHADVAAAQAREGVV